MSKTLNGCSNCFFFFQKFILAYVKTTFCCNLCTIRGIWVRLDFRALCNSTIFSVIWVNLKQIFRECPLYRFLYTKCLICLVKHWFDCPSLLFDSSVQCHLLLSYNIIELSWVNMQDIMIKNEINGNPTYRLEFLKQRKLIWEC